MFKITLTSLPLILSLALGLLIMRLVGWLCILPDKAAEFGSQMGFGRVVELHHTSFCRETPETIAWFQPKFPATAADPGAEPWSERRGGFPQKPGAALVPESPPKHPTLPAVITGLRRGLSDV